MEDAFVETGDIRELVRREVGIQVKPFVQEVFHEHERLYKKQEEILELIKQQKTLTAEKVIQYVWLLLLTIMFFTMQGG